MSDKEFFQDDWVDEDDDLYDEDGPPLEFEFRSPGWDRFLGVGKVFLVSALVSWMTLIVLMMMLPIKMPRRERLRIATWLTAPAALGFAARRFLLQHHRLGLAEGTITFHSPLRAVTIDPAQVQGIVGAGGIKFDASDSLVWKYLVVIADGRRYAIALDPLSNVVAYAALRHACEHAWGVPFRGALELPPAGPELDPVEYVEALGHVRSYYLLHTQKSVVTGLLMLLGSVLAGVGLAMRVGLGGQAAKAYFWLLIIGVIGMLVTIRAARQVPVLWSIGSVERRLRDVVS